jgi:hypothetical protein
MVLAFLLLRIERLEHSLYISSYVFIRSGIWLKGVFKSTVTSVYGSAKSLADECITLKGYGAYPGLPLRIFQGFLS